MEGHSSISPQQVRSEFRSRLRNSPFLRKNQRVNYYFTSEALPESYLEMVIRRLEGQGSDVTPGAVLEYIVDEVERLRVSVQRQVFEPSIGMLLELESILGFEEATGIYYRLYDSIGEIKYRLEVEGVPLGVSIPAERFITQISPALTIMLAHTLERLKNGMASTEVFSPSYTTDLLREALRIGGKSFKDYFATEVLAKKFLPPIP